MRRHVHRRRSGKSYRWLYALLAVIVVAVAGVMLAPVLVMSWVRGYLQEDAFRAQMEGFFGTELQGSVELAPLRWTGDEVTSPEGRLTTASGWTAEMHGAHMSLDWNAFRQGVWRVMDAGTDDLTLHFTAPPSAPPSLTSEPEAKLATPIAEGSRVPSWLRSWIPTRSEIEGIQVHRIRLEHPGPPGPWLLRDSTLRVAPWKQETSWQVTVEGGVVETPVRLPAQRVPVKLNLTRATARLSRDEFLLKEATLHWIDASEFIVRGSMRPREGSWKFNTHFTNLPLSECLDDDWRLRLTGKVEGDLETSGKKDELPVIEGDVQIREGVLTALPILEQLSAYTGVERFKRLLLDIASAHVRISGDSQQFDKIVLQSNGLLRVEGNLSIRQGQLDGTFLVGVNPETLTWIPGAQQHVFTLQNPAGTPGMVWTTLRITGPMESPREDLSNRLLAAAGKAVLDAPGQIVDQGSQMLLSPVLGKDAAAQPGAVMKGATDAAGKAVDTGVKLLEGFGGGLFGK